VRFGYTRTYATFAHATADGSTATDFGFKGIPTDIPQTGGLPRIQITNYQEMGTRNFRPQFQKPHLYQILDSVSLIEGKHSLRMGFELLAKDNDFIDIERRTPHYRFRGKFTGDSLADLFLGLADRFRIFSVPIVDQKQQAWSGYLQDDWKITPRLTFNAGLRYEYTTPYYGTPPNRNINFDFVTGQLVTATDSNKCLVDTTCRAFGPRLGRAYQLKPNKVVLRAGYGIFYSGQDIFGSDTNLPLNPPQLVAVVVNNPPFKISDPIPDGILSQYD